MKGQVFAHNFKKYSVITFDISLLQRNCDDCHQVVKRKFSHVLSQSQHVASIDGADQVREKSLNRDLLCPPLPVSKSSRFSEKRNKLQRGRRAACLPTY